MLFNKIIKIIVYPTIVYANSFSLFINLQNPKSAILTVPLWNKILDGFKSLCKIFNVDRSLKAIKIYSKISRAYVSVKIFYFFNSSSRVPLLQYS